MVLFALLVGGFVLAFAFLGNRGGGGPTPVPKWKVGQTVDVEITLVSTDYKNLGCAMAVEVAGKHCAFETQNKKLAGKSDNSRENANLLQPYTTVDGKQLMAAGLWIQPALKAKLDKENWDNPSPRFTVKCKFKVEGKAKEASIRWKPGIGWNSGNGWWVGTVSNCKLGG
ncbi:MAG TPA: hypothetical protein ENK23_04380 [Sorangium sp.]|nr:hypothetical protein [Sorangium sp.]